MHPQNPALAAVRSDRAGLARAALAFVLALALAILQAGWAQARGAPESFADLAEQVSGSVVNITTSTLVSAPAEGEGSGERQSSEMRLCCRAGFIDYRISHINEQAVMAFSKNHFRFEKSKDESDH